MYECLQAFQVAESGVHLRKSSSLLLNDAFYGRMVYYSTSLHVGADVAVRNPFARTGPKPQTACRIDKIEKTA